jgi:hypothetical protein
MASEVSDRLGYDDPAVAAASARPHAAPATAAAPPPAERRVRGGGQNLTDSDQTGHGAVPGAWIARNQNPNGNRQGRTVQDRASASGRGHRINYRK